MVTTGEKPFMYGSHYSTPGYVLYWHAALPCARSATTLASLAPVFPQYTLLALRSVAPSHLPPRAFSRSQLSSAPAESCVVAPLRAGWSALLPDISCASRAGASTRPTASSSTLGRRGTECSEGPPISRRGGSTRSSAFLPFSRPLPALTWPFMPAPLRRILTIIKSSRCRSSFRNSLRSLWPFSRTRSSFHSACGRTARASGTSACPSGPRPPLNLSPSTERCGAQSKASRKNALHFMLSHFRLDLPRQRF